ncbi:MAG: hypothetical protein JXR94_04695 [Candidatus Hydrogenedentes bacterium]|nr:hypothetical protein [Candidatus Hydrogenedentota bacterium]
MKALTCPHCGNHRIVTTKVPKDVIVVVPCPSCGELVVLFRNKAIALNREIVEKGSFEDRKIHFAEIIAEFLESGMFTSLTESSHPEGFEFPAQDGKPEALFEEHDEPITEREFERFVRVDLKRIDEASYFRKHFG